MGLGDCGGAIYANPEFGNSVVKWQIDEKFAGVSGKIFDIHFLTFFCFLVGDGAVGVDIFPHAIVAEAVEVGAFQSGVCHVKHVSVPKEGVFNGNAFGVGGKTHADTAATHRAFPQGGAHAVFEVFGDASESSLGVVKSFVDYSKVGGIDIFERFCLLFCHH